jgi:hypothetical protein
MVAKELQTGELKAELAGHAAPTLRRYKRVQTTRVQMKKAPTKKTRVRMY